MTNIFQFGEHHADYAVPVINEREARAGAGILFLLALIAFMNAWLSGNFAPTKLVSLVLGRIAVRNQLPEYVGAPQKRFAWAIGLALASAMLYLVVFNNVRGPVNILVCALCLLLLFFETAFGICIGCRIYNLFNRERAQLCPGGVCDVQDRQPIQQVSAAQYGSLVAFLAGLWFAAGALPESPIRGTTTVAPAPGSPPPSAAEEERCRVPELGECL